VEPIVVKEFRAGEKVFLDPLEVLRQNRKDLWTKVRSITRSKQSLIVTLEMGDFVSGTSDLLKALTDGVELTHRPSSSQLEYLESFGFRLPHQTQEATPGLLPEGKVEMVESEDSFQEGDFPR